MRADLCQEAIRLGRILVELLPDEPEARGLLALMLLHDSRRATRTTASGDLVLLEDQDRGRWNAGQIEEGLRLVAATPWAPAPGGYALQAAIAAEHARAAHADDTDWVRIEQLYAALLRIQPSPVTALNHAVALAMAEGPARGLHVIDQLEAEGSLAGYYLLPAAQADLLRRLGRSEAAAAAYRRALELVSTDPERRFLERRLGEVEAAR